MRRMEQIIVSLLLVLTLLTGCGGNSSDKPQNWIEDTQQSTEVSDQSHDSQDADDVASPDSAGLDGDSQEDTAAPAQDSSSVSDKSNESGQKEYIAVDRNSVFSLSDVPTYSGDAYVAVNDNTPYFDVQQLTNVSVEYYSPLDSLERCGMAYACVGQDIMPTEDRGNIGMVKPTGWHTVKYDCVDGGYLYNRCHLIGYQLSGENANTQNLITGTRYLNIQGMLPFENMVADYVKETENHVAYRVTPIFDGDNLVASGVLMEGYSVEDAGDGICFCVFAYNIQPGITIEYATGESALAEQSAEPSVTTDSPQTTASQGSNVEENTDSSSQISESPQVTTSYILNTNTKKFHYPTCSSVGQMKESNKQSYSGSRDDLIAQGYSPCGRCHP